MTTVEELYKAFGALADAKDKAGEHEAEFRSFLEAAKGTLGEKRLASQFICRFFKFFPSLQEEAINTLFELCEDVDASIRKQTVKDITALCRANKDKIPKFADALSMLLGSEDAQELSGIQASLYSLFSIDVKGALEGIFSRLLQSAEDENTEEVMGVIRERLLKFLVVKLKQYGELEKDVEDLIMEQCQKLLEDVTKDEFIAVMDLLRSLKTMTTVQSRQQLLDMVIDQAALDEPFEASDPDCVDRLLHCIKSATPMFSKNVHSKQFVAYICDHVLPALKDLASPDEEINIQLEVLKTFAEISEFAGDIDHIEKSLDTVYSSLLDYMPLPPSEESEEAANEDPKLNFSQVECLMFAFHQLGRKKQEFLTSEDSVDKLKDFRVRLQYIARGSQMCVKKLKEALQGKAGADLRTDENKKRIVALKLFTNITALVKDLMHNPPSYKTSLTLSWRPSKDPKAVDSPTDVTTVSPKSGQKRSITPITFEGSNGKKANPKQARSLYQPPSGKFSDKAGTYTGTDGNVTGTGTNSFRGNFRGNRGRGGYRRGGGTGFYQNSL